MKAIIFDAFGTLFKVTNGGSARSIMQYITEKVGMVDEKAFLDEWKSYYKKQTADSCMFLTERNIFISRIQMFYDRYGISRNAEIDADALLAEAFRREAYTETKTVLNELMKKYKVFIGSNTDNDVLDSVMSKNDISVHKVYTSENLKCYKPSPLFYQKILIDNDLLPQEVLFVGDSVTDDVRGPKSLEIRTVWIDREGKGGDFGQDFTVKDLNGVWEVLECAMQSQLTTIF